mgnify:CR=1 FL=1
MLNKFQIDMLATAAQHEGYILQIFTVALMHDDYDTVKFIASNYLTTAHFSEMQITAAKEILSIIAQLEQQAHNETVH